MTLATFLQEKNFLSNQELNQTRNNLSKIATSKDIFQTFKNILNTSIRNPDFSIEQQSQALMIIFQELLNPLSWPIQLNYTLLFSVCTSLYNIGFSILLLAFAFVSFIDMCSHFLSGDKSKADDSLNNLALMTFGSIGYLSLGAIGLTLGLLAAALSLITRPLATACYAASYGVETGLKMVL